MDQADLVYEDVEVKKSPISGRGVFARRKFLAGETVLHWRPKARLSPAEVALLPAAERHYVVKVEETVFLLMNQPERYVNHSCRANTAVRDGCDVAVREIPPGEEITSDYGLEDGSLTAFCCSCGTADCRGWIGLPRPE